MIVAVLLSPLLDNTDESSIATTRFQRHTSLKVALVTLYREASLAFDILEDQQNDQSTWRY